MKPYIKSIIAAFLVIVACLGFGRFAFGMVLPNIQASLDLNATQAGFIGTANFIGYFIGIFFANALYSKYATHRLIRTTIILQAVSMLCMIGFEHYIFIALLYAASGFFAAISNISIMAYMANVIPKELRGKALGIVVSGSGLAIILSGQIVPVVESYVALMPWKTAWVIFAFFIISIAFLCQPGIKKHAKHALPETKIKAKEVLTLSTFWKISVLYMIFGFTYSIYVTFFVSAVMDKYTISTSLSGDFWTLLGFMSIFSGFIFGFIADKIGAYKSLVFVYAFQTIAHIILGFDLASFTIWISAFVFGASVWSIPSLIALLCSIHFDVKRTAQVLSLVTMLFATCQAIGPVAAGFIYDITESFNTVFLVCALLTLFGMVSAFIFSQEKKTKVL